MLKPFHRVLFICRGSVHDGIGHVIRTRTIARAMKQFAIVRVIAIGDQNADNLLARQGLDYVVVKDDAEALEAYHRFSADVVVFDLMYFDEATFDLIQSRHTTASLSPIFNCIHGVDVLFHRSKVLDSTWHFNGERPRIYADIQYTVVGEHCQRIPSRVYEYYLQEDMLAVAVSMGGTDAANKTLRVLEELRRLPVRLLIWVLLGEGYAHSYESLVNTIRQSEHEIILAKTNDAMWRILSTCSLAILAAGTTTYEAVFAGLPSINLLSSPQHYFLIQELVEEGVALCAGMTFDSALEHLNENLLHLYHNRQSLIEMHHRAQQLVDGRGVARIIEGILHVHERRLTVKGIQ
jgi:spore coat polysaccharide biosynthesis predicted glycosyltransferase SpsG